MHTSREANIVLTKRVLIAVGLQIRSQWNCCWTTTQIESTLRD